MALSIVQYAVVKGLTWMDLYVGSAREMAKLLMAVHQKTQLTLTSINLHAKTMPINILS
jgi:hypothetical protein